MNWEHDTFSTRLIRQYTHTQYEPPQSTLGFSMQQPTGIETPPTQAAADTLVCANPACSHREEGEPRQSCSTCGTPYCGDACQKQHWKAHKKECKGIAKELESALKAGLQRALREAVEWQGVDKDAVRLYANFIHRAARGQTFIFTTFEDEAKEPRIIEVDRLREQTGVRGNKATFKAQLSKLRTGHVLWVHKKNQLEWSFNDRSLYDPEKVSTELRQLRVSPPQQAGQTSRPPPKDVKEWDDQRVMQHLAHNVARRIQSTDKALLDRITKARTDAGALYVPSAEDMLGAMDNFIVVKAGVAVKDPLHTVLHCLLKKGYAEHDDGKNDSGDGVEIKHAVIVANEVFIQWAAVEHEKAIGPNILLAIQIAIRCFQPVAVKPHKQEDGLAAEFSEKAVIV